VAQHRARAANRIALLLLPVVALIPVLPLILHGCSCGHDLDFHLQSWLDAAAQMRHGTLDPHWTVSAAWNAGEPRFLFYPPLSWMLGALLTLALPIAATPAAFTWIALAAAALAMFFLAREFSSTSAAVLASALYLANPYLLFTAFERSAYGELLAAGWMPLLLLGLLKRRPAIPAIAVPLALLWLTNAPAAVIGTYAVVAVALARTLLLNHQPHARAQSPLYLSTRFTAALALGLALPAFYLLPAAIERRYVQVAMAIIPNMRFQDNFLFGHTGDVPHDQVLHTASLIAITLLALTAIFLASAWLLAHARRTAGDTTTPLPTVSILAILTALIALLLTPASTLLWSHLPELAFLQFPWRLLSLLDVLLALSLALILRAYTPARHRPLLTLACALALPAALTAVLTAPAITHFRQGCEVTDAPAARAQLFRTHHGAGPTDEYTPIDADNDVLRSDDPGYWLATDPAAFAPGTMPNPAATILNDDTPPPLAQTLSTPAPHNLTLNLPHPAVLVLNLRDYPAWRITRNGAAVTAHLQRDDGLLAFALPAGVSQIEISWRRTADQWLGVAITLIALFVLTAILIRSRTISTES
jgi:hypothetical protein